jgi:hypothetical protein
MPNTMNQSLKQKLMDVLDFTHDWIEAGIIDVEALLELNNLYSSSDDKHTSHYRWLAFQNYCKTNHSSNPNQIERIYEIAVKDIDIPMGSAMIFEIIKDARCPMSILEKALLLDRKSVQTKADVLIRARAKKT